MLSLLAVYNLHQQRPLYVELRDLVERRGRQEDLGTIVEFGAFGARGHNHGVASVVLVETLDDRAAPAAGEVVHVGFAGVEAILEARG